MAAAPRVAMLIDRFPPDFTGAGRQLWSLIPYLQRHGIDLQVLTSRLESQQAGQNAASEPLSVYPMTCFTYARAASRARRFPIDALRWLRENNADYDICHIHGVSRAAMLALLFCRKPTVLKFTLIGSDDPRTIRHSRFGTMKMAVLKRATRFIATSTALFDIANDAGLPAERTVKIPNGCDTNRFRPSTPEERIAAKKQLVRSEHPAPVVLFAGSIERRKGLDILPPAWAGVVSKYPDARLVLAGPVLPENRDYKTELYTAFSAAGLAESVTFIEDGANPVTLYRAADLFVFPSRNEGLPNALIEAQACGLPAVAAALPGITDDIIADGETGIVVPQESPDAIARALNDLLGNAGKAAAMGQRGADNARSKFSLETIAGRYAELYASILTAKS